jgi:hypothetical protein
LSAFRTPQGYRAAQGVGRHFEPSGSFLKCVLVMN